MKPSLNKYLRIFIPCCLSVSGMAHGDYNGGQIVNQDNPGPDTPLLTGEIAINHNIDEIETTSAAIHLFGEGGNNKAITLEGNISITTGNDYQDDTENSRYLHGIFIGKHTQDEVDPSFLNSHIILKTQQASDKISINTYAKASAGVMTGSPDSTITLDASNSTEGIEINIHNSLGGGIRSYGVINILGKLKVTTIGVDAYGLSARGLEGKGIINATGPVTIDTQYQGVVADSDGTINIQGSLSITSGDRGILTAANSTVTVHGSVDIVSTSTFGIVASGQNSTVSLLGGATRIQGGNNISLCSWTGGTINGSGKFTFNGNIRAHGEGSTIDLSLTDGSKISGATLLTDTGTRTINISLAESSHWTVTTNSAMTDLTLDGTSSIMFEQLANNSFTNINAASISLASGAVLMLGADSDYINSLLPADSSIEITLFTASGQFDDQGAILVTSDQYVLDFTMDNNGKYTIQSVTDVQIPEPATASLGLSGLLHMILRRRKR